MSSTEGMRTDAKLDLTIWRSRSARLRRWTVNDMPLAVYQLRCPLGDIDRILRAHANRYSIERRRRQYSRWISPADWISVSRCPHLSHLKLETTISLK